MTKKAVVLAAGRGDRLARLTETRPKALVPVAGKPLVEHVLTSLARAGVCDVVLVLGHRGEQIEARLGDGAALGLRLQYAWNRDGESGNATSLRRALPLVSGEPFLLAMSDHLCSASLLRDVLASVDGRSALAVDRSDLGPERTAEATKVALSDGLVSDLGKHIDRWDAVDTGVSYWAAGAFAESAQPADGELAALMAAVARSEGGLAACDVSGRFWLDVDTEADLCEAERLLAGDEDRLA